MCKMKLEEHSINKMGRPSRGQSQYDKFQQTVAPLRRLISETINNGTGNANSDYATLLRTSIVGGKKKKR